MNAGQRFPQRSAHNGRFIEELMTVARPRAGIALTPARAP